MVEEYYVENIPDEKLAWREYPSKRRRAMLRECDYCGEIYKAPLHELRVGRGKFCSQSCASRYQVAQNRTDEQVRIRQKDIRWSSDIAYIVGLIAADGNLTRDRPEIKFSNTEIALRDHYISVVKEELTRQEPGYYENKYSESKVEYQLKFTHRKFYQFLQDIGLTPNKTFVMGEIDVPDEFFADFFRGEFDGDGNVGTGGGLHMSIASGSRGLLDWMHNQAKNLFQVSGGRVNSRANRNAYRLNYYKGDSIKVYNNIYKEDSLFLPRKKEVFENTIGL